MPASHDFLVDRADLGRFAWEPSPAPLPLGPSVLLAVRRFAFTTNNITYARCGDSFHYWDYFPACAGWGRIPVWGVAEVVRSGVEGIEPGERVYGFMPISGHLVLQPEQVRASSFLDGAPHRSSLPRTYNEYARIDRDPSYGEATADLHLVLRPLFALSFFMAEFLKEEAFFGARQVVVSSASSKSALGLAFLLRRAGGDVRLIGLSGPRSAPALAELGRYDRVLTYEEIDSLDAGAPSVFVDLACDPGIVAAVHRRLAPVLRFSSIAGFTRGAASGGPESAPDLPGPAPEVFFTPSHILARRQSWGADELRRRLAEAWRAVTAEMAPRLRITTSAGRDAIERVYADVLNGRVPPDEARILSLG